MTLPPQSEGVTLQCERNRHAEGLHQAIDGDGITRRWPDAGDAAIAAGVQRLEVRPRPRPDVDYSGFGLDPA